MKNIIQTTLCILSSSLLFAESPSCESKIIQSQAGFSFKVAMNQERKAELVFLDSQEKPLAIDQQSVSGLAGERSAPTKLNFIKSEDGKTWISDVSLPNSSHVAMLLVIQLAPDAKPITERFVLHAH